MTNNELWGHSSKFIIYYKKQIYEISKNSKHGGENEL